jgi:trans-2,3-dihydro-3-hydroxyanthranilate isomerase
MRYRFYTCDVFTHQRFGGNPLAVLPQASGLSGEQMQRIAREFNYSETTFVLPAEAGHTRRVRIFTPFDEIPFAGHPNVGTAFVLAATGELGELDASTTVTFEEDAGPVPVHIELEGGRPVRCELTAPEALSVGGSVPVEAVADALSLAPGDFATEIHPPQSASVGLPFLFAQLRSLDALARVRVNADALEKLRAQGSPLAIHVYVRSGERELRARMLVAEGGYEDPATGSANCALAALLGQLDPTRDGELRWEVTQGVEMGRPSTLRARVEKRGGAVASARIGGASVLVCEGSIEAG